jgi:hypothetical protein
MPQPSRIDATTLRVTRVILSAIALVLLALALTGPADPAKGAPGMRGGCEAPTNAPRTLCRGDGRRRFHVAAGTGSPW